MTNPVGNLRVVSRLITAIGEDLENGEAEEVAMGIILNAVQVAILTGKTLELAALVKLWADGKLAGAG